MSTSLDDQPIRSEQCGSVLWVTLDRPQVRNAFNPAMIAALTNLFTGLGVPSRSDPGAAHAGDGPPRAVVLAGAGQSFSAGADLAWMRSTATYTLPDNEADAARLARMFDAIEDCPLPVVARVHGAALGGGMGLVAACDVAIAAEGTVFGFTEARLGIAPAVISPYVLRAIGPSHARALFVTGERFDSARAERIGLVHRVVDPAGLDAAVEQTLSAILACGPAAVAACKRLVAAVPALDRDGACALTTATIAALRASDEGQEGMQAFLEKRTPWYAYAKS